MNKSDLMISTLPIKPQKITNIGMMIAPTIMDYIGSTLEIEKNIGFNILHSYETKSESLDEYLNYVKTSGINYDSIFVDKDYDNKLLEIVFNMIKSKHIVEKEKEIIRCSCGKVDMINSINENGKLYIYKDGKVFCKNCGQECIKIKEMCLVYNTGNISNNISIAPIFLKKDIVEFENKFSNKEILVSKARNTGYVLEINNRKYNIDVDFLWSNYFKIYKKHNQIFIASNHQLFNMFLMNNLANKTSDIKLTFIASPYLNVNLTEAKRQYELRKLKEYKALLLLYNLKWKNKNCAWSNSNTEYLSTSSDTRLINLYKSMIMSGREIISDEKDLDLYIYDILNIDTNMQSNIKIMKQYYKEGRL